MSPDLIKWVETNLKLLNRQMTKTIFIHHLRDRHCFYHWNFGNFRLRWISDFEIRYSDFVISMSCLCQSVWICG